jgi:putative PIN family toxin of toxin-antitoxin system
VRVLLDTNVLISAILFRGLPRALLDRAIRGELDLVTSPVLLDELERILTDRFQVPSELARLARSELEILTEVVVPDDVPAVSRDPDDDQVLAAAVVGDVEAIVTGDRDLHVLETHRRIAIISPAEFESRSTRIEPTVHGGEGGARSNAVAPQPSPTEQRLRSGVLEGYEWAGPEQGPAHPMTIAHERFGLLRGFVR